MLSTCDEFGQNRSRVKIEQKYLLTALAREVVQLPFLSVCPSISTLSFKPTFGLDLLHVRGHYHDSQGIETERHKLGLGSRCGWSDLNRGVF